MVRGSLEQETCEHNSFRCHYNGNIVITIVMHCCIMHACTYYAVLHDLKDSKTRTDQLKTFTLFHTFN